MGFFSNIGNWLWGNDPEPVKQDLDPATEQLLEYFFKATFGMLSPQIAMLNYEAMQVPASGSYISGRSRGYIMGLIARVLGDFPDQQTLPLLPIVGDAAFEFVYGSEHGPALLAQSVQDWRTRDPELVAGSGRGEAEADHVLTGRPFPSVMGFWQLNNGLNDQGALIPLS